MLVTIDFINLTLISNGFFNRLSFGIQSFDKYVLNSNNRKSIEIDKLIDSLLRIKSLGIENINIDLMVGLYNQSFDSVRSDISILVELISQNLISSVTVYPRSYFSYSKIPTDEIMSKEYLVNLIKMQIQYKMFFSNELGWNENPQYFFSKNPLSPSSNNTSVDTVAKLGFGNSAYSFFDNSNFRNSQMVLEYIKNIESNEVSSAYYHKLGNQEMFFRYLVFGVKRGFSDLIPPSSNIDKEVSSEIASLINRLCNNKFLKKENGIYHLTSLGKIFTEYLIEEINKLQ